jgi:hypothetical protein
MTVKHEIPNKLDEFGRLGAGEKIGLKIVRHKSFVSGVAKYLCLVHQHQKGGIMRKSI